jgi:hypothetical protein
MLYIYIYIYIERERGERERGGAKKIGDLGVYIHRERQFFLILNGYIYIYIERERERQK